MSEIKKIAVIGAGTMGHGIAETYAAAGYETVCIDTFDGAIETASKLVEKNIMTLLDAEYITKEEALNTKKYLKFSKSYDDAKDADLCVEAVPEKPEIKADVFKILNSITKPDCILTSTTSAMNVYAVVSSVVDHPERILITHFNNPSHIIPLVEIVAGPNSSKELILTVRNLLESIGKSPVVLNKYIPGFIVNRLNAAMLREASFMVEQGWVTPEDVDTAFSANQGLKAPFEGPLELMDYIGWDVAYGVGKIIYPFLNSSTEPARLAADMIREGKLGIKTGKGLNDYTGIDRSELQAKRDQRVLQIAKIAKEFKKNKLIK